MFKLSQLDESNLFCDIIKKDKIIIPINKFNNKIILLNTNHNPLPPLLLPLLPPPLRHPPLLRHPPRR